MTTLSLSRQIALDQESTSLLHLGACLPSCDYCLRKDDIQERLEVGLNHMISKKVAGVILGNGVLKKRSRVGPTHNFGESRRREDVNCVDGNGEKIVFEQ